MRTPAYFALGIMVAALIGCAVAEQGYQVAGEGVPLSKCDELRSIQADRQRYGIPTPSECPI
jgi:hypothetical protein